MVNLIEQGNDLVIPSRFVPGGKMLGAGKIKEIVTRITPELRTIETKISSPNGSTLCPTTHSMLENEKCKSQE